MLRLILLLLMTGTVTQLCAQSVAKPTPVTAGVADAKADIPEVVLAITPGTQAVDTAHYDAFILPVVVLTAYRFPLIEVEKCGGGPVRVSPTPSANIPEAKITDEVFVTGTVTDEAGEPLPGAYISWASAGAVTDMAGRYQLSVTAGTELTVSYLGYTATKLWVGPEDEQVMDVALKSGVDLPAVVVTGYGVRRYTITNTCFGTECFFGRDTVHQRAAQELIDRSKAPHAGYLASATVYPNPFVGELSIDLRTDDARTLDISLTDASGRRVAHWPAWQLPASQQTLHLRPRPNCLLPGTYFLRLTDDTGRTTVRKLIRAYGR